MEQAQTVKERLNEAFSNVAELSAEFVAAERDRLNDVVAEIAES